MGAFAAVAYKAVALAQWMALVLLFDRARQYWPLVSAKFTNDHDAYVWGGFAAHAGTLLAGNVIFYALYKLQLPYFEQFRVAAKPWPWQQGGDAAERLRSNVLVGTALQLFNLGTTPFLASGSWWLLKLAGFTASPSAYPSGLSMLGQIAVFMLLEDFVFYWAHRFLHSKWGFYKHIHKVHHRFYYSVSIAAEATHPVEYLIANVVPFTAGPVVVGLATGQLHAAVYYVWFLLRITETVSHHSGYEFPWLLFSLLPFQGTTVEHDLHHSVNTGNYGSLFTWWDALCGTGIPEGKGDLKKHQDAKKEAKKAA